MALEVHGNLLQRRRENNGVLSSIPKTRSFPVTLDLFDTHTSTEPVELEEPSPLPSGWQKFLDLKTGTIYYTKPDSEAKEEKRKSRLAVALKNQIPTMSRNGKQHQGSARLDLKLNLSPTKDSVGENSSPRSSSYFSSPGGLSPTSPPSSCISSEMNQENKPGSELEQGGQALRYSNSPEATSMVLVGCPRCLMYVMLSEEDPKCPKCKSTVLLDFLHDSSKKTRKN